MASILAEMDRDAIGTGEFGQGRRPDRIGFFLRASLAEGRDMVDVNTQAWHAPVSSRSILLRIQ